jgi:hypothetical protein
MRMYELLMIPERMIAGYKSRHHREVKVSIQKHHPPNA